MATNLHPPAADRDLGTAVAAVDEAYSRLVAVPRTDPELKHDLLHELQHRAHELAEAAAEQPAGAPHGRRVRVRCRCVGAERGARWIEQHVR